ncbi:hypothetical protein [Sinorhizobium meliloti]|uniref:hypothetical protein n=1 Tax=Rhizobium meliloti TaxID=382 RepID=UPI0013E2D342|nr:hypothetical protein [Sinorhizobium meliloti]
MTDIITVALSKLDADPRNVRKTYSAEGIEALAAMSSLTYSDDFCDFRIDRERRPLTTNKAEQIARDGSGAIEQESALVP